jgi:hypothetical protein
MCLEEERSLKLKVHICGEASGEREGVRISEKR